MRNSFLGRIGSTKTLKLSVLGIVFAVSGMLLGQLDQSVGMQMIYTAVMALFIRDGVAKSG